MPTRSEFITQVNDFFEGNYSVADGTVIPDVEDVEFGNKGKRLELAMLFIDIRESTKIVDGFRRVTAAKMYKSFLWGVAHIARMNGGELRSFNGDGVLIAFIGDSKCTHAAKAAMQMSWFAQKVLQPKLATYFEANEQLEDVAFDFGIGIDLGTVLVVRGGIRGENNNDLVWVGNATNFAVKLSGLSKDGYHIYITEEVYKKMNESSKLSVNGRKEMWESRLWTDMENMSIYRTNWHWAVDD